MYLSRVALEHTNVNAVKALSSPQVMHAMLKNCLPDNDESSMWRIDRLNGKVYVLLKSKAVPTQGVFSNTTWETLAYDTFLEKIENGQIWRFRLCANPVHSVKAEGQSRGKVYAHVTVAQQLEWLLKRTAAHGFSVPKLEDTYMVDVVERATKKFKRQQATVTLSTAAFEGVLRVENVSQLVQSLENGIGRGKAYGCGLLTLARM